LIAKVKIDTQLVKGNALIMKRFKNGDCFWLAESIDVIHQ